MLLWCGPWRAAPRIFPRWPRVPWKGSAIEPLGKLWKSSEGSAKALAAVALLRLGKKDFLPAVRDALRGGNLGALAYWEVARALGEARDRDSVDWLIRVVRGEERGSSSGMIGGKEAVDALLAELRKTPYGFDTLKTIAILGELGEPRAIPDLAAFAGKFDVDWRLAVWSVNALGRINDERATAILIEALKADNVEVQEAAAYALGNQGAASAIQALKAAAGDQSVVVRRAAAEAIRMIATASAGKNPSRQAGGP